MNRYGQTITFGPLTAPKLFTGDILSYTYRDAVTDQDLDDVAGDITAVVLHSQKASLNFESAITSGSKDFLDLSSGGGIAVDGITTGMVIATRAIEKWVLGQRKTAQVEATHFPDFPTAGGSGSTAGSTLDAFTPDQSGLDIVYPGDKLIYGTHGLDHAAGVVHELTITQTLKFTEDEPSPDGKILGGADHGYRRTISLLLLAKAEIPAIKSELELSGAPGHASKYRITSAEKRFERLKGKMYAIEAVWIPPFGAGGGTGG